MDTRPLLGLGAILTLIVSLLAWLPVGAAKTSVSEKREFNATLDGRWIGNGISYSPYRDGESPGNAVITEAEILQDLEIIGQRWHLIRLYGSDEYHQKILEVIAQHDLPIRVMLGIWLDGHKSEAENQAQVDLAIELANRFPEIVRAVNVGNEILVY